MTCEDASEQDVAPEGEPGRAAAAAAAVSSSTAGASSTASSSKITLERDRRRRALRTANLEVWLNGPKPPKGPFDSNIKKNTGFIKRVKQTLGTETRDQLAREITTLNLDKYIDEVVQAVPEGLGKCTVAKDCVAAAEVSVA